MSKYCCTLEDIAYTSASAQVGHSTQTYHSSESLENGYTGTTFTEGHNENYNKVALMQGKDSYEASFDHHLLPLEKKIEHTYEKLIEGQLKQPTTPTTEETTTLSTTQSIEAVISNGTATYTTSTSTTRHWIAAKPSETYKDGRADDLKKASTKDPEPHVLDRLQTGWVTKAGPCCK